MSIEFRQDRRKVDAAWLLNAQDGLRVLACLRKSLLSLLNCCQDHSALIETHAGMVEDFSVAADAWNEARFTEALAKMRELAGKSGDMLTLSMQIRREINNTAAIIEAASKEMTESIARQAPRPRANSQS